MSCAIPFPLGNKVADQDGDASSGRLVGNAGFYFRENESIQCLTVQAEVFRSNWVVMIPARSGIWPLPAGTCCGQLELSEMDPGDLAVTRITGGSNAEERKGCVGRDRGVRSGQDV